MKTVPPRILTAKHLAARFTAAIFRRRFKVGDLCPAHDGEPLVRSRRDPRKVRCLDLGTSFRAAA